MAADNFNFKISFSGSNYLTIGSQDDQKRNTLNLAWLYLLILGFSLIISIFKLEFYSLYL